MKTRLVQITGLSSYAKVNIGYSVEYKKNFFSKWKVLYQTDYVSIDDKAKVEERLKRCQELHEALKVRGAHKIKTIIG
ncbi:tail fiber protein [Salmonella phage STP4-a]|uniref:Tail fiber protein n=1 Tax=Salmonella phage STP4-a TaxID=1445860 RepID=A0A0B4L8X8_9CAUD|nr:hypothetical protein STP4a_203 [Salmonella phage STP4-a]AHJ86800.1 tail fiber protein [Salmonella phage STP4-a]